MTSAIVIAQYGGPEVMQARDVVVGHPGPDQVKLQHTRIGATRQGGVDAAAREQNAYVNDPLHAVPKVKNPAPIHARRAVGTGLGCQYLQAV